MKLRLSPSQMLDLWRLHAAYMPSLNDAVFLRNDGIDTAAIHRAEMNRWYHRLLLEAPASFLVPDDLSESATLSSGHDGSTLVSLPENVVRVLGVRLASWKANARIVTSPTHILAVRQRNPFTRATSSRPVAVFTDGELHLYPAATATDSLTVLSCVSYSEDEYCLDDTALAELHL